ncbi:hypothetical protein AHiyo8_02740 [Arthrobacter sp. Hiyo8]|nr:hypothetical protein AHiyo8_02740 [Arthrobacter sp. Hiyo8]
MYDDLWALPSTFFRTQCENLHWDRKGYVCNLRATDTSSTVRLLSSPSIATTSARKQT